MKKTIAAIFTSFVLILSLAGCSGIRNKQAKLGETVETAWFYMNVMSVNKTQSYGEYTAEEGNTLIDVVVYLENNFTEPLYFATDEFTLNDPVDPDYVYIPFGQEDIGAEDVAPYEFSLAINGKVEYHLIYEVPSDVTGFILRFVETYEDETIGDIYYFDLEI